MSDASKPSPLLIDDPDGVFEFSASAITTWQSCNQKWAYNKILGLPSPSGEAAALGTKCHSELEAWTTTGAVPTLAPAKRLLPLLPSPTHPGLLAEHRFRILFAQGAARGFIDLLVPEPVLKKMPVGDWRPDTPVVIDFKTTSNLDYAKDSETLKTDPQALLYGVEARRLIASRRKTSLKDVPEVDLMWAYSSTRKAEVRPVHLRQSLAILEDGLGPLLTTAGEMSAAMFRGEDRVKDLPYDLRHCEKFGGCPYQSVCSAYKSHPDYRGPLPADPVRSVRNVATAVVSDTPKKEKTMPLPNSALLAKLAAASKSKPKSPAPALEVVTKAAAPGVTDEPGLPKPDTSGLNTPIPAGTSPINPPDAAPNVSENDPPQPEVVAAPAKPKGKPGRPKAVKAAEVLIYDPAAMVETSEPGESIEEALQRLATEALAANRLMLASQLIQARLVVLGGG